MRRAALVLLAVLAAAPALAAEPQYSPALQRCLNSPSATSTLGQKECVWNETKVQDARLNVEYARAMGRLTTPGQKTKLRAAQRAWIVYRDADCAAREDAAWGTLSQVNAAFCILEATAARADMLAGFPGQ